MNRFSFVLLAAAAFAQSPQVTRFRDPVTNREVTWYRSPHHEVHNYYDISPWNPQGDSLVFFRFDASVEKLTALGSYPGSLWTMQADGSRPKRLAADLKGNYHTGVSQFWGPGGKAVYFTGRDGARRTNVVTVDTGQISSIVTPAPASRMTHDGKYLSIANANEWGLFDIAAGKGEILVTRERALALTPHKELAMGPGSALQNARFSHTSDKALIVHRTNDDFPRLVEMFVYDFASKQLSHMAAGLHHPSWRPDGKAILFVHRDPHDNFQSIREVDVRTGKITVLSGDHVPSGHPSYHPTKHHWIVTDCYGGPMGFGLALINTKTKKMTQLVTIPSGAKPVVPGDERFAFRNWGLWIPVRPYLNEPRPVWNADGSKILFTSQESGRINLYTVDTSDLE